jgi:hypothetical protein
MNSSQATSCENEIKAALDDVEAKNVLTPKIDFSEFLIIEIIRYCVLLVIFLAVGNTMSDNLTSKETLLGFVESKVNVHFLLELGLTIFAVVVAAALILLLTTKANLGRLGFSLSDDFLEEIPRTIYLFGSSVSSCLILLKIAFRNSLDGTNVVVKELGTYALMISVLALVLGIGFKRLTNHKNFL